MNGRTVILSLLVMISWSLVGCTEPIVAPPSGPKAFVGSGSCAACHQDIYDRWKDTPMAKVLQDDPQETPTVILGDFSTPDPLVTFEPKDITFTYGSKWKQRYFTKISEDYFVFPAQWDIRNGVWRRYYVEVRNRLVGAPLSSRADGTTHRSALRRVPLDEL